MDDYALAILAAIGVLVIFGDWLFFGGGSGR
jgi:hypothetical protein